MFNYANLNDVEFEYLCQDIMQKKLNVELHRFARGRDGGIDLTDDAHSKNIIVQVKHYMNSSVSQLITSLEGEAKKVAKLSPKEYYVCCSKTLSPQKVDEVYQLFSAYMSSTSNIMTLNEIDDFLNEPANADILERHYKLWIESTGILQNVGNTNVFIDCETLLADIENQKNLFVKTAAFNSALRCLQDNKTLFITGNPGVGKTVTSKMLVLYYAASGYKVRFSTNISDLDALKRSLSRNPETKEIILVDDCFGQAYYNMKESQNEELLSLINYVNASANKLLILNSRITILQEAKGRRPELLNCLEGKRCKVYVLDMTAIDIVEKAKIFYNHISFNGMREEYFAEIKKDKRYHRIIRHANYTPRIIEFICNPNRYKDIPPSAYFEFVMKQLNDPKEIWKDEYERRLEKVDRLLLLTLYSLSDSAVSEEKVKYCFECRIARESDIDTTINQYEASLSRLLEGFVQIVYDHGVKKLSMVNPSVNDYIDGRLNASRLERNQLINSVVSIQQKKRLLSEVEFDSFVKSAFDSHEIDSYQFDSELQKNAFVTFYICKYKMCDASYTNYVHDFLNNPYMLHIYGNESISAMKIFREVFQPDICEFYKIADFFSSKCALNQLLEVFDFDEMVEVIDLIDVFYNGETRDLFVETVSERLRCAIEALCEDLSAEDIDPDIFDAIEKSRYFNGVCEDIDISKAASYIETDIMTAAEEEIDLKLSTLPEDIRHHRDYTDHLTYSIYGAEDLIKSYLEYDGFDYDDYRESRSGYRDVGEEIDYIFNRN